MQLNKICSLAARLGGWGALARDRPSESGPGSVCILLGDASKASLTTMWYLRFRQRS